MTTKEKLATLVALAEMIDKLPEDMLKMAQEYLSESVGTPAPKTNGKPTKTRKRKQPRACRVPGCHNPNKGPRFDFFCEKHLGLTDRQKQAAKDGAPVCAMPGCDNLSFRERGEKALCRKHYDMAAKARKPTHKARVKVQKVEPDKEAVAGGSE